MILVEGNPSMTKKLVYVGMAMLVLAMVALAADAVTGKWVYEQQGRDGTPRPQTIELKAEGATLTGTVSGGMGRGGQAPEPQKITNGKVGGNNVTFEVTREFGGNSMTTKYAGVVSGSEMKLKITRPGFQGGDPTTVDVTAKKQ
jgi:hypothetical protein